MKILKGIVITLLVLGFLGLLMLGGCTALIFTL